MVEKGFKELVEEIRKKVGSLRGVSSIIVFGSVARGEADRRSDLDLAVVLDDGRAQEAVSKRILELEGEYDVNIEVVFLNAKLSGVNRQLLETILREGKVISGKMPDVSLRKLGLEPYRIIKYDLKALGKAKKDRVNRLLFGKRSEKSYGGRRYVSEKKGLVRELGGLRIGIASLLFPQRSSREVERLLRREGVKVRGVDVWMAKP
ncbi:MAG: nucleotidyltransferase domain-containing protein [Candidatus Micrarchaeia archaeon]